MYDTSQPMRISPWTFIRTTGDMALSQITGAKDYGSLELPGDLAAPWTDHA